MIIHCTWELQNEQKLLSLCCSGSELAFSLQYNRAFEIRFDCANFSSVEIDLMLKFNMWIKMSSIYIVNIPNNLHAFSTRSFCKLSVIFNIKTDHWKTISETQSEIGHIFYLFGGSYMYKCKGAVWNCCRSPGHLHSVATCSAFPLDDLGNYFSHIYYKILLF